jgi:hypothetical protein
MTNYTDRKFWISNIKYLCSETITKASMYKTLNQTFHRLGLKEIPGLGI